MRIGGASSCASYDTHACVGGGVGTPQSPHQRPPRETGGGGGRCGTAQSIKDDGIGRHSAATRAKARAGGLRRVVRPCGHQASFNPGGVLWRARTWRGGDGRYEQCTVDPQSFFVFTRALPCSSMPSRVWVGAIGRGVGQLSRAILHRRIETMCTCRTTPASFRIQLEPLCTPHHPPEPPTSRAERRAARTGDGSSKRTKTTRSCRYSRSTSASAPSCAGWSYVSQRLGRAVN